jgi:hypothetical protein
LRGKRFDFASFRDYARSLRPATAYGFQPRFFWASNFKNFTFFWSIAPIEPPDGSRQVDAASCHILGKERQDAAATFARYRGLLDYFPPARASFSSGIRGVEKTA